MKKAASADLQRFFTAVRGKLAAARVLQGPFRSIDSSQLQRSLAGIIFPRNRVELAHVMRNANRFNIEIHPISTGHNYGYGDFYPKSSSSVVINLKEMNRILELNADRGWMRIEPGVTQADIQKFLNEKTKAFEIDMTAALPETSFIGNALERGRTILSEREKDLIGSQLMLIDGRVIKTGFDPSAKSPLPSGINLHPLIFQSNLGIVIEGVIRIREPNPQLKYYLLSSTTSSPKATLEDLTAAGALVRPLRWFCAKSLPHFPVASLHSNSGHGAVVIETTLNPKALKSFTARSKITRRLSRKSLFITAPRRQTSPPKAHAFASFSTQRTPAAIDQAHQFIERLKKSTELPLFVTISFLDLAAVFVIKAEAANAADASRFQKLSALVEAEGYALFRQHSALRSKKSVDKTPKLKVARSIDPRQIISPGRYDF